MQPCEQTALRAVAPPLSALALASRSLALAAAAVLRARVWAAGYERLTSNMLSVAAFLREGLTRIKARARRHARTRRQPSLRRTLARARASPAGAPRAV